MKILPWNETFRTHTGEIVGWQRLAEARNAVADDYAKLARDIRTENCYASHVTEEEKEQYLREGLETAERIRNGTEHGGFWLWQRLNTKITGECVALLPK